MGHMTLTDGVIREFQKSRLYDDVPFVMVDVYGTQIEVKVDPVEGPKVPKADGSVVNAKMPRVWRSHLDMSGHNGVNKPWSMYTSTEREQAVHLAAKMIKAEMGRQPQKALPGYF
eukprot:TRINITY_DN49262_c0_g1_i1.p1 TRINITY_DN49262_c0_g1~~TRINITY_DN49262_c0_g1_i1.p1  ORF type:complete len:115 (+),score=26.58 TRINITY_DN49262_c0_g1_i1:88-432(+)